MSKNRTHEIIHEITTDEEIQQEGRIKDYQRKQSLLDTVNTVIRYSIIIVPFLVLLWGVIITIHFLIIGDWKSFYDFGRTVGYIVIGYVISYLQQHGINKQ